MRFSQQSPSRVVGNLARALYSIPLAATQLRRALKDVPDNTVVGGVPARRISSVDEYMEKMKAKSWGLGRLAPADKAAELKRCFEVNDA